MSADETLLTEWTYAAAFSPGLLWGVGVLAAIGIVLLAVAEARLSRAGIVALIALPRLVVVAAVLWMLVGLSIRTETRTAHRAAVAVMTDVSASMSVRDPVSEDFPDAREMRWAVASIDPAIRVQLSALDGATACAALAERTLARVAGVRPDTEQLSDGADELERAAALIVASAEQLDRFLDRSGSGDEAALRQQAATIRRVLRDEVAERIRTLQREAPHAHNDADAPRRERLNEARQATADVSERLAHVAEAWTAHAAHHLSPTVMDSWRTAAEQRRFELLEAWTNDRAGGWLAGLERRADLHHYQFAGSAWHFAGGAWPAADEPSAPLGPENAGADFEHDDPARLVTDLAAPFRQLAADASAKPIGATVLLTDGAHNSGPDPVTTAADLQLGPLFIVPIGRTEPDRDVVVHHARAPATVFENDVVIVEAMLDAYDLVGRALTVDLHCDDVLIESRTLVPDAEMFVARLRFEHTADSPGHRRYTVAAQPLPDERVQDNNEARLDVEVMERQLHVLLVDRLPRWEFRFLSNLFKRDPRVEAEVALLDEPRAPVGWTASGLPETVSQWEAFRVVILGDVDPHELNADRQEALAAYVRQGGTLVVIAGSASMPTAYQGQPFERLLPVQRCTAPAFSDEYQLFLTRVGLETPVTQLEADEDANRRLWREQITVHELSPWACPRPAAHVLIACGAASAVAPGADAPALLSWHHYGRGRVVYLAAPVTYQLRQRFGDQYHHRFWGQLLRWAVARRLAGGAETVQVRTDKNQYAHDEPVRVSVQLADLDRQPVRSAEVSVEATQDGRSLGRVVLYEDGTEGGRYVGVFDALPVGTVALTAQGPQVAALLAGEGYDTPAQSRVQIEPALHEELRRTQCDLALLTRLADATGGLVVPPTALEALIAHLELDADVAVTYATQPAWNRGWMLWLIIGCLSVEWITRKLAGLA